MDVSDQHSQSDPSLRCPPEEALHHWLSTVQVFNLIQYYLAAQYIPRSLGSGSYAWSKDRIVTGDITTWNNNNNYNNNKIYH